MKSFLFLFIAMTLLSCNQSRTAYPQTDTSPIPKDSITNQANSNQTVTIQQPKTSIKKLMEAEPRVLDWVFTDAKVLYIVVKDDGTRRDGYAEYFCQLMKDEGHNEVNWVKIVEYGTTKSPNRDNAYGILLGDCMCN